MRKKILICLLSGLFISGCQYIRIEALKPPEAAFDFENNGCVVPCTVLFKNESPVSEKFASADKYKWVFGDGNEEVVTDLQPYPHPYLESGEFEAFLIAVWDDGPSDTSLTKTVTILKSGNSAACEIDADFDFTAMNGNCDAPCIVTFETSTSASTYLWEFGDGNTSTDFRPEYTYQRPNTAGYQVKLTITQDTSSCVLTKTVPIQFTTFDINPNGAGPATDIIQLDDGGFVWVGYGAQLRRIDKNGNELWTQNGYNPNPLTNFYGVIQDSDGKFIVAENKAISFFDRSQGQWVRFSSSGKYDLFRSLFDPGEDGNVSDITLADNDFYLFVGTQFESNGTSVLTQFSVPKGGSPTKTIFGSSPNGAYGGRIHQTDNGIFSGGYLVGTTNPSKLLVDGSPYAPPGQDFIPFVPFSADEIMVMDGPGTAAASQVNLYSYSLTNGWNTSKFAEISKVGLNDYYPMEIIQREEGGFAGVVLVRESNLIVGGDINNPNGLFFLLDSNGQFEPGFPKELGLNNTSDYLFNIKQTRDGGYVIVGSENGNPRIIKTDDKGNWE